TVKIRPGRQLRIWQLLYKGASRARRAAGLARTGSDSTRPGHASNRLRAAAAKPWYFRMNYYLLKLLPPRPTFVQDMTPAEAKLMQEHGVYWRGLMARGYATAFGLVA